MSVDEKLFDIGICRSMGRHGTISGLVGIVIIIEIHGFSISFSLSNDAVGILGIVFGNLGFDSGRVKDGHVSFVRINSLADGFHDVNKLSEEDLNVPVKFLFEPCYL